MASLLYARQRIARSEFFSQSSHLPPPPEPLVILRLLWYLREGSELRPLASLHPISASVVPPAFQACLCMLSLSLPLRRPSPLPLLTLPSPHFLLSRRPFPLPTHSSSLKIEVTGKSQSTVYIYITTIAAPVLSNIYTEKASYPVFPYKMLLLAISSDCKIFRSPASILLTVRGLECTCWIYIYLNLHVIGICDFVYIW